MKEIAFLEIPGLGINRLWWAGGRYAAIAAHMDGFTDHFLCMVDLKNITKPEIVGRWWMPGMNRAAGEPSTLAPGRRVALHHMITAGNRGYGAWRDGGFTVHDLSDPTNPKMISHIELVSAVSQEASCILRFRCRAENWRWLADEPTAEKCAKGMFTGRAPSSWICAAEEKARHRFPLSLRKI